MDPLEEKAYLVGIHRYSFRAGVPAEIIGVKFITPDKDSPRACYHIAFDDFVEDYVPIDDGGNYSIISESDFKAKRIPEVTQ